MREDRDLLCADRGAGYKYPASLGYYRSEDEKREMKGGRRMDKRGGGGGTDVRAFQRANVRARVSKGRG